MSIQDLKSEISEIIGAEHCGAEFYFLTGSDTNPIIKRADIEEDTAKELSDLFIENINQSIILNADMSLIDVSSADERKDVIYKYDLAEIPVQIAQLNIILNSNEFENFDFNDNDFGEIKGIVVVIGSAERQFAIYKHQYPTALIKRDSKAMGLTKHESRLTKLEGDILRVNSTFEFMMIGGDYFIVNIKTLEKFFGFHEAINNLANQGLESIRNAEILLDVGVLSHRVGDISFARKLVRATKNSPVLGIVSSQEIISFVMLHPALKGKFKFSLCGTKIDLKTKVAQNLFLKLLSDDYLQSELTKRHYASLAKDVISLEMDLAID